MAVLPVEDSNTGKPRFIPALVTPQRSLPMPERFLEGYWYRAEPRMCSNSEFENKIIAKVDNDWYQRGGCPIRPTCPAESGPLLSAIFPEGDPERLRNLAYLNALGFIQDDFIDDDLVYPDRSEGQASRDVLRKRYETILCQLRAKEYVEIFNRDEAGTTFVETFEHWARGGIVQDSDIERNFEDLDDYVTWRIKHSGTLTYGPVIKYLHHITLTDEQEEKVCPALRLIYAICLFANDIFSVEVDWLYHQTRSKPDETTFSNGVYIAMRLNDVTVAEAKQIVKEKILEDEGRFLRLRDQIVKDAGEEDRDLLARYLSYAQWIYSGYLVHLKFTPRYRFDPGNPLCPRPEHKLKDLPGGKASDHESHVEGNAKGAVNDHPQRINNHSPANGNIKSEKNGVIKHPSSQENVPERSVNIITNVIDLLHSSSLIIDDIEDNSALRRGQPSAHMVFGTPQAINAANYLFVKSLAEIQSIFPEAVAIYTDELQNLHLGQGYELHWTFHGGCPTEAEYIQMIDGKTGGLFRMASRLMKEQATQNRELNVEDLLVLMGRFFQIRDDFQNLESADYARAKGSLSDLDEGKYSFMLIHSLKNAKDNQLKSLLRLRSQQGSLTTEQKTLVMNALERTKSMEYTMAVLEEIQAAIDERLEEVEAGLVGQEVNWVIRAIMVRLRVSFPDSAFRTYQ
ncbi:hypothetical protein TWF696_007481 [Orbilia brochopaga]|uniref:Uncharacterized protein n=1 Tax=Orbilia brochopaga TaxID=3140254 RepID=A0AAV9UNN3_9PEZI